jgi:hypothetical protein
MGKMRKRTVHEVKQKYDESDVNSISESSKYNKIVYNSNLDSIVERAIPLSRLEPRNIEIGQQVGIDFMGPILSLSTLNFTDKASGYCVSTIVRKDGKRISFQLFNQFSICMPSMVVHSHHTKEWHSPIREFRCDSDPVLLSSKVQKLCKENGVEVVASA